MNEAADPDIRLIIGLGNPSVIHSRQRHNVGFWCLNLLAFAMRTKFKTSHLYWSAETEFESKRVTLAKPRTFMNESGRAAASLLAHYKLRPEQMLVICDSLDMPVAQLRLRPSGGHGGHNGLRSIVAHCDSQAFARIRIGIGRPRVGGAPTTDPRVIAPYVLGEPSHDENRMLDEAVARAAEAVEMILRDGFKAAMSVYNSKA